MKSLSSQKLSVACSVAVAGCLGSVLAVVGGELEPSARGHAGAGSFSDTVVTIAGDKDKVKYFRSTNIFSVNNHDRP